MSKRDEEQLAIQLDRENLERGRSGLSPVQFQNQTPPTSTPQNNAPATTTAPVGSPTTYNGPVYTAPKDASVTTSRNSLPSVTVGSTTLSPVSNAKTQPLPVYRNPSARRSASHRSSRASSSRRDDIGTSLELRDRARYEQEAANARAQAAAARSRGEEDDVARSWEDAARTAEANAQKVGQRRTSASSQPRQYTEGEIRAQAQSEGKDPDAAVRWARQNGRLRRGN